MLHPIMSKYRWKIDKFDQEVLKSRMPQLSTLFRLNDKPEADMRVSIRKHETLKIRCDNINQVGGLNLVSKFWLERGSNKFGECVEAFVLNEQDTYSINFMEKCNKEQLEEFVGGGSVTVCFNIILGDSVNDFDEEEATPNAIEAEQAGIDAFMGNIGKMYSEGHHDLTIQVGEKKFNAVKHILMGHSEIFKVILSSPNSIKAQSNVIKISDNLIKIERIGADVIEAMLKWMHFSKVDNLDKISEDLYEAGYKYQIAPLMNVCTQAMSKNLSMENLLARVFLAEIYQIDELKNSIIRFVQKDRNNSQTLIASEEWALVEISDVEFSEQILNNIPK